MPGLDDEILAVSFDFNRFEFKFFEGLTDAAEDGRIAHPHWGSFACACIARAHAVKCEQPLCQKNQAGDGLIFLESCRVCANLSE